VAHWRVNVQIRRSHEKPAHYIVCRDGGRSWRAADLVHFLLEHEVPIWFGAPDEQPEVVLSFGPLTDEVAAQMGRRFTVLD
jgi:hypothetical protein